MELAESAFERTLSALTSIDGVLVIGPETTLPYADSQLSRDDIDDISEKLGAVAVLQTSVRAQGPVFSFELSLSRPGGGSGYGAPIGFLSPDTQITIYASDGQAMALDPDAMLEMQLSRLVNDVQALFLPESIENLQQITATNRAIFLDTSLRLRERMDALRELTPLRMDGRHIGKDAKSLAGEVAAAAVDLATTTDNAFVREQLWRAMTGIGDPYLMAPLLQSLASDPDKDVRIAAAKALQQDFFEEPSVRDALEYAMTSDPSEKVRTQIGFSMLDAAGQTEALSATVLNKFLPDWDRTRAFSQLLGEWNATNEVDAALTAAMVELTLNTRTPRARIDALSILSRVDDPSLADLFLTALARDSDEGVRETGLSTAYSDISKRTAFGKRLNKR